MRDSANFIVSPAESICRRAERWQGFSAEAFEVRNFDPLEYSITPARNLFVFAERAARHDGETRIDGLPPSIQRNFDHSLCIVPQGHCFAGWQRPRVHSRAIHIHVDLDWPLLNPELRPEKLSFGPSLFVDSAPIEATVLKIRGLIGSQRRSDRLYAESLGMVLQHELLRFLTGLADRRPAKGALAPWQERRVREFIEANISSPLSLATLAALTGLSIFHFAHAFKTSFRTPPYRYFASRRIARSMNLLDDTSRSMTGIALEMGFSDGSSFAAAFRRATGMTPSEYRATRRSDARRSRASPGTARRGACMPRVASPPVTKRTPVR